MTSIQFTAEQEAGEEEPKGLTMTSISSVWAVVLVISGMTTIVSSQCFTETDGAVKTETSLNALSVASTNFAYDLFRNVVQDQSDPRGSGNVFISPISVWSALGICYLGTEGQTKEELGTSLGIDNLKKETLAGLYPKFQDGLLHDSTSAVNYTFNLVNKLYFDKNFQIKECIAQRMDAKLEHVDFWSAPQDSRELINKYVEEQTDNKIVGLIPPGQIDSNTLMVIVNAAYFKGAWENSFKSSGPNGKDFFVEPSRPKKTMMMNQAGNFPTAQDPVLGCSVIELPFSGNEMSMLILLPDSHDVVDLIQKLTKENVEALIGKLAKELVDVTMPKFKITQDMELKENIKAMGVNDLFDPNVADLTGFTGSRNSFVTFIRHKTFMEVNENGVEAAASTGVGVGLRIKFKDFKIDRPFVFMIRNKKLDVITFIGLIKDPTATK